MKPFISFPKPSSNDFRQRQLAKRCYWDAFDQRLYVDARELYPEYGVMFWLGWDAMLLDGQPVPDYPVEVKPFDWPKRGDLQAWIKQIPEWVWQSCQLFPSHQLRLLHFSAKYPQVLELLDHSPVLAWRLVASHLPEPEIVALLSGKRSSLAASVGWYGKDETVKFLRKLRLRFVNEQITEHLDTCLLDEKRLSAMAKLPRINSMALTLAAAFPELIGSQLHQSLAQLPCRPMQCQSMIALLQDTFLLAELTGQSQDEINKVGACRYLEQVRKLYLSWFGLDLNPSGISLSMSPTPKAVSRENLSELSARVEHPWHLYELSSGQVVVAWQIQDNIWSALVDLTVLNKEHFEIVKVRGLENRLPDQQAYGALHLWLLRHWNQLRRTTQG